MTKKKLKIALAYSTVDTIPPSKNTINAPAWLVFYLAEILTKKGHSVTLFAIPGSKTKARLVAPEIANWPKVKYIKQLIKEKKPTTIARHLFINEQTLFLQAYLDKQNFDVIHVHNDKILPMAALFSKTPTLMTYHGPYDPRFNKVLAYYKKDFPHIFASALSHAHANHASDVNFDFIVNNGLNLNDFKFSSSPKKDLLFAGRIMEEKGSDIAVQVAKKTKKNLILIGDKFYSNEKRIKYWDTKIAPYLGKQIKYGGLIPFLKIKNYYADAKIVLFPDRWKEAFGLVPIEAMACGTPVIATNRGIIPEIVKDGITGYIVKTQTEMIRAVKKIYSLPPEEYLHMRQTCRDYVEKNFTIEKMVDDYEQAYYEIVKKFNS